MSFQVLNILNQDFKEVRLDEQINNLLTLFTFRIPNFHVLSYEFPYLESDVQELEFCYTLHVLVDFFREKVFIKNHTYKAL